MIEIKGNLWDYHDDNCPVVITTNGNLKVSGNAVMGKGIALEAAKHFPRLPKFLGQHIQRSGNVVKYFPEFNLFSFPTKNNWWENSDLELIRESTCKLRTTVNHSLKPFSRIYMVRPGCNNGKLQWATVKNLIEAFLDDRFIIVNK